MIVVDSSVIPREFCRRKGTNRSRPESLRIEFSCAATHLIRHERLNEICRCTNRAQYLPDRIVAAVVAAESSLQEAEGWGCANVGQYTNCRRWITQPDKMLTDSFGEVTYAGTQELNFVGPINRPWLTVLSVRTKWDSGRACWPIFRCTISADTRACRPTIPARYAYHRSNNWAAAAVAIMSQGTSGESGGATRQLQESDQRDLEGYVLGLVEQTKAAIEHLATGCAATNDNVAS